jgi:hypothetical protein
MRAHRRSATGRSSATRGSPRSGRIAISATRPGGRHESGGYSHRIAGQLAADADTLEAYLQGEAGRSRSRCSGRGAGRLARGLARKAPGRIVEPNVTGLGD